MHSIETGRGDFLLEVGAYRWRSASKTFTPSIETRLPKRMYEAELASYDTCHPRNRTRLTNRNALFFT